MKTNFISQKGHFPNFFLYKNQKDRNCSGQKTPDFSRGRLSEALGNWGSGNLEGEGLGKGLGQGRSVYKQPETEVDGSCHS
jgi:hypothetical protein